MQWSNINYKTISSFFEIDYLKSKNIDKVFVNFYYVAKRYRLSSDNISCKFPVGVRINTDIFLVTIKERKFITFKNYRYRNAPALEVIMGLRNS